MYLLSNKFAAFVLTTAIVLALLLFYRKYWLHSVETNYFADMVKGVETSEADEVMRQLQFVHTKPNWYMPENMSEDQKREYKARIKKHEEAMDRDEMRRYQPLSSQWAFAVILYKNKDPWNKHGSVQIIFSSLRPEFTLTRAEVKKMKSIVYEFELLFETKLLTEADYDRSRSHIL